MISFFVAVFYIPLLNPLVVHHFAYSEVTMLVFLSFWQLQLQITGVLKRLYFSYGNLNIMTTPIIIH